MKKITFLCFNCLNNHELNLIENTDNGYVCNDNNVNMTFQFKKNKKLKINEHYIGNFKDTIGRHTINTRFGLFNYDVVNTMDEQIFLGFECPNCENIVTGVPAKEFFKLKAEKDLTLKKPPINPDLELAKQGTYNSPNDLSQIIKEVTEYIESTNSDKYGKSPLPEMLGPDGKAINTFQIKKYLTRYMSKGFEKSELRSDLLKIIHYAMFELLRTKK